MIRRLMEWIFTPGGTVVEIDRSQIRTKPDEDAQLSGSVKRSQESPIQDTLAGSQFTPVTETSVPETKEKKESREGDPHSREDGEDVSSGERSDDASDLGLIIVEKLTYAEKKALSRLAGSPTEMGLETITSKQHKVVKKVASFDWSPQAMDYWRDRFHLISAQTTPNPNVRKESARPREAARRELITVVSMTDAEKRAFARMAGTEALSNQGTVTQQQYEVIQKFASINWTRDGSASESRTESRVNTPPRRNTTSRETGGRNAKPAYTQLNGRSRATANRSQWAAYSEQPKTSAREASQGLLNDEQQRVFNYIENSQNNMFITGRAGSGKSHLLRYFLENTTKRTLPVAFMGVAALNIGGSTIHSTFGLPTTFIDPKEARKLGRDLYFNQAQVLRKIDTIVVDEISMVSGDMFQAIDVILRVVRETDEPFGGVQLLLFGDPYQLPPIVSEEDIAEFYADNWGSEWFFSTPAWHTGGFLKLELQTSMRQSDPEFLSILDSLRVGEISFSQQEVLNDRITSEREIPIEGAMRIAGTGVQADSYNNQRLTGLPGKSQVYRGRIKGNYERNTKRLPAPLMLSLKPGAQVLMVKNDTQGRWVNGSLGAVAEAEPHRLVVNIKSFEYEVDAVAWKKYRHKYDRYEKSMSVETIAEYQQYPVDLGWARTIHKSQGQTFEKCVVDLNRGLFEKGQAYVAMSRCRSLDGLFLTAPLEFSSILSSDLVHEFMSDLSPAMSLPGF